MNSAKFRLKMTDIQYRIVAIYVGW